VLAIAAHVQALLSRDSLLPTLARVLREDGMKSLELATAIAGCFLACSSLAQLHKLLLENQVRGGLVCCNLMLGTVCAVSCWFIAAWHSWLTCCWRFRFEAACRDSKLLVVQGIKGCVLASLP
jgi:hypothetical protein